MKDYEAIITLQGGKLKMNSVQGRTPKSALNKTRKLHPTAVEIILIKG